MFYIKCQGYFTFLFPLQNPAAKSSPWGFRYRESPGAALCIYYVLSKKSLITHKLGDISLNEYDEYNQRQDIAHINPGPCGKMNSLPFIGLRHKFLKAPSVTAGAKQQIKHAADRQKVVAEDKILQIQNRASLSQGSKAAPEVKAQHTRKG